ncbi:tetratricopeptide repeat-containing diguanylate cyclase [Roseateles koreensis]|uniref:diguanylate cyclase n=1 Tax=Roseateles koreensis TaxID=2987526 RepID=A0ABT5KPH0_9BURK|nr:tetratricopeptide repeat-containing diguanylate cyclase [Roseateles koreensis]MDC8784815.1 diguanylate cyclase [Roseateles koreensis]
MQDVQGSEATGEQIQQWLAQAQAQQQCNAEQGLAAANKAWKSAQALGFLEEHLAAGALRVFYFYRLGDMPAVLVASQALLPQLRQQGSTPRLCELLRRAAFGAAEVGEFELALAFVNESLAVARELGDKRLIAVSLNAVGACLERMGDPWQAERLMNEASALLGDDASDYERMVSNSNLAIVALGLFNLLHHSTKPEHQRECSEALDRAYQHALAVRAPALALGDKFLLALGDANRGEALMRMDRCIEADELLQVTLQLADAQGFLALGWRLRCNLAEMKLAQGQAEEAAADLDATLAASAGRIKAHIAMQLHHAAYRAHKTLGHAQTALGHLEQYQGLAQERNAAQMRAQARFFVSRVEAVRALDGVAEDLDATERDTAELDAALSAHPHGQLFDPLTGLGNQRLMAVRMPAMLRRAERTGAALTVALVDVDHFKLLNDRYGRAVADRILQVLAQMLRDNTRGSDLLVRWGGEEFLVVLPDTVADRAFEVCERLRETVEAYPWSQFGAALDVTLSIGLANAPPYVSDLLVTRAESAMFRAKHLGRNRVALA